MSHGFSAVKEQGLDGFAERFTAAGLVVLAFDHRHLGDSDGDERGRIVYFEQHDDTRAALGWLEQQPGVDGERMGLWGSSYSGAHAVFLGAFDPRVKVVVSQVPGLDVVGTLIAIAGREGFVGYLGALADDHARRNAGEPSAPIPVVAPAGEPSVLATPDSYDWFIASRSYAPNWLNQTTLESVARAAEYKASVFIELVAPKPLLSWLLWVTAWCRSTWFARPSAVPATQRSWWNSTAATSTCIRAAATTSPPAMLRPSGSPRTSEGEPAFPVKAGPAYSPRTSDWRALSVRCVAARVAPCSRAGNRRVVVSNNSGNHAPIGRPVRHSPRSKQP